MEVEGRKDLEGREGQKGKRGGSGIRGKGDDIQRVRKLNRDV